MMQNTGQCPLSLLELCDLLFDGHFNLWVGLRHSLDVAAGAEGGARAGDQQRADIRIFAALLDHSPQAGVKVSESALRASGRFSVISATPSRTSHSSCLVPVSIPVIKFTYSGAVFLKLSRLDTLSK